MIQRVRGSFFGTGVRAIHRAEKFLVLRGRYEMLIQSADASISPTIAEMFDRVPRMTADSTSDEYLKRVKDAITWSDVDVLSEAVIGALPDADLRDQLNFTRLAYMQTVPSSEYSRYEKSMFDLGTMTSPLEDSVSQRMRSELLAVSQRVKYMLEYGPPKEEARARLTTRVILTMCVGIFGGCTGLHWSRNFRSWSRQRFRSAGGGLRGTVCGFGWRIHKRPAETARAYGRGSAVQVARIRRQRLVASPVSNHRYDFCCGSVFRISGRLRNWIAFSKFHRLRKTK